MTAPDVNADVEAWLKRNGIEIFPNWRDDDLAVVSVGKLMQLAALAAQGQGEPVADLEPFREAIVFACTNGNMDKWRRVLASFDSFAYRYKRNTHLTQPAQAVDAVALEAVIRELCKWPNEETFYDHRATRLACAEKLRALGNAQAEGWKEAALDALRGLKCPHDGKNGDVYEKAAAHVWGDAIIAAMRAVHTLPTPPQPEE